MFRILILYSFVNFVFTQNYENLNQLSIIPDYDEETCIGDCKRLDFIVNFKDIGWEKWIVYPRTFNAYTCSGSCSAPLTNNDQNIFKTSNSPQTDMQVTNHAQLMSIIEYKENRMDKMTSCVPTKFKPLKVIYINAEGEIDIQEYENMIVKQCGCR
jgi:hypothetical protein